MCAGALILRPVSSCGSGGALGLDSPAMSDGSPPHEHPEERIGPGRFRVAAVAIGLILALKVAILAAVVPPFAHIDETEHYDLSVRYAEFRLPRSEDVTLLAGTASLAARYQTEEWFNEPSTGPLPPDARFRAPPVPGVFLDPEALSARPFYEKMVRLAPNLRDAVQDQVERKTEEYDSLANFELFDPPAFPLLSVPWLHAARGLGAEGLSGLLALRWFTAFVLGLGAVATAYCLRSVSGRPGLSLAATLLFALVPQDVEVVPKADMLGLLAWSLVLLTALRVAREPRDASLPVGLLSRFAAASAFAVLVRPSGGVAVGTGALLLLPSLWRASRREGVSGSLRRLAVPALVFVGLVAPWALWARSQGAGLFGGSFKLGLLNMKPHTRESFLDHPLWTWDGFELCLVGLQRTWWRGELFWEGSISSPAWFETGAWVASVLGFVGLVVCRKQWGGAGRFVALVTPLLSTAFIFAILIPWNAEDAVVPFPFTHAGRLVIGGLPFLCLGLCALGSRVLPTRFARVAWLAVASVFLWITVAEAIAFASSPHALYRLL